MRLQQRMRLNFFVFIGAFLAPTTLGTVGSGCAPHERVTATADVTTLGDEGGNGADTDPDGTAPGSGDAPDGADDATGPTGDITSPGDTTATTTPGRVVWRRLNRNELANTWRDLIGTDPGLADDLPADDTGYGFDNIASVLTLSPLHIELLERATDIIARTITTRPITTPQTFAFEAEVLELTAEWGGPVDFYMLIASGGDVLIPIDLPRAGTWTIEVRAFEQAAGPDHARFALTADQRTIATFDVTTGVNAPRVYTATATLPAGRTLLAVSYLNDYWDPPGDRNLAIDWVRVRGPAELDNPTGTPWAKVITCTDAEVDAAHRPCAIATIEAFADRAFRRPDFTETKDKLVTLFDTARAGGASFLDALTVALQATLLAPQSIFRSEFIPNPDSPAASTLDPWAIASRLSYFLWSTMPDEALFEAARSGRLASPEGIATEVRRMLADPRAEALISNFAGQWLYIRDIANVFPDPWLFPEFDESLRAAMTEEMNLFFRSFVFGNRNMLELLTATDTRVNRRLAEHYGLEDLLASGAVTDETFVPHDFDADGRIGLFGKAGLMTTLATPFRTSIVRRGKWVLGQLLCSEPRAPPPGVEGLIETTPEGANGPLTLREKMELHKTEPACISCHQAMDPIGFALENYDGIGAWRDTEAGLPIDNRGELSGGRVFHGPAELAAIIAADQRLPHCIAEKLFIYALGRGIRVEDDPALAIINHAFAASGFRLDALVTAIATTPAFRAQEGQTP